MTHHLCAFLRVGVLFGAVACTPLQGCSFVAVEDIEPNMTTDPGDCAALNADPSLGTGDECFTWQLVDGFCRLGTRDSDGDGAKDPDCAAPDDVLDCDADDDTRAPNLPELCDGIDNDCDERVDEDVFRPTSPSVTQAPGGIENLSFASPDQSPRSAALFTSPLSSPQHVLATARFSMPGSATVAAAGPVAITAPPRDGATRGTTAVAALNSQSYVAVVIPAGCQAPMLARFASESAATDFVFPPGHFGVGLPTASGERCSPSATGLRARTPALGASGTRVLTAWVAGSFITSCGTAAESAPVLVNGASFNGGSEVLTPSPNAAVRLGDTNDAAPPAVLRVGTDRFVVAHADGGELVLSVVDVADGGGVSTRNTATYDTGGLSAGDLVLAAPAAGDLLVAFRLGCGTQARVMVARTGFDVDTGMLDGVLSTPQPIEAVTSAQRRPRIAIGDAIGSATVAWEANNEIRVRQLGANGLPVGAAIVGYTATGTLGAGHHLYRLPESSELGLIVSDTAPDGSSSLASLELTCAP